MLKNVIRQNSILKVLLSCTDFTLEINGMCVCVQDQLLAGKCQVSV